MLIAMNLIGLIPRFLVLNKISPTSKQDISTVQDLEFSLHEDLNPR